MKKISLIFLFLFVFSGCRATTKIEPKVKTEIETSIFKEAFQKNYEDVRQLIINEREPLIRTIFNDIMKAAVLVILGIQLIKVKTRGIRKIK